MVELVETRWWWVRHAPVPDGGRIYGQSDLDCDTSAAHVFDAVAAALPTDAVWVTSHLKRTTQTAAALVAASRGRLAPQAIVSLPTLAEQHLGEWQGLDRATFRRDRGLNAASFWFSAADERAPNGESFVDLITRVEAEVRALTTGHSGRDIVAVTHGGTIRAALGLALGLAPDAVHAFTIDNVSLTRLDHIVETAGGTRREKWRIGAVNHRPWSTDFRPSVHA
jgi:broad specificity phosphatase PhoE